MQMAFVTVVALVLGLPSCLAREAPPEDAMRGSPHPIERVISLLQGLSETVESERKEEAISFKEFEGWCASSLSTLNEAITKEREQIDTLESTVESKKKEKQSLTEEIAHLEEQIAKHSASGKKAEAENQARAKLYGEADSNFDETIDAVDQAIKALEGAKGTAGGAVLLQRLVGLPLVMLSLSTEELSMLQNDPNKLYKGEYRGTTVEKKYEFKSGNVIDLLKQLKSKFQDDKLEATKAETAAQNDFAVGEDARKSALAAAESSKDTKTTALGDCESDLAAAQASLEEEQKNLEADSATLEETQTSCAMKKSEWAERSKMRDHELEAIAAAIKILAKVGGVRTEQPENPVPPPSPLSAEEGVAFFQLSATDPKMRAVNLLRKEAKATHSRELEKLAMQVAAHLTGPFDDLNNMIQKMIFRLMAEQNDENAHKAWCDVELEKTNSSMTHKQEKIKALTIKIEDDQATMEQLAVEITDANKMVTDITAHVDEATAIRLDGKKENAAAIKDAEEAQAAIASAVSVLEDFYKKSGMVPKEPWEFLQTSGVDLPSSPSTWEASYTGVADPTGQPDGIVSVLKEVSSDFARMEADTRAQEEMDKKANDEEMKRCAIEKARRQKEADMKAQEESRLSDKVKSDKKTMKHFEDQLGAWTQYLKDLAPACVTGDSTFEDRKASRAKEIDALKEAQAILANAFEKGGAEAEAAPAAASVFLQSRRH